MFTVTSEGGIDACLIICLLSQGFNLTCEILKFRSLGKEYWYEFYHWIEIIHIAVFAVYFSSRINFHKCMLPETYLEKYN